MKEPNFFIVGIAKCGTSSMHLYLSQHPDVFMSRRKESLHFATDLLPDNDPFRDRRNYLELFADSRDEKAVGESSVYYLFSRDAAQRIHAYNPAARIIVMLRDPTEMIYSYHGQLVLNGDEPIEDLRGALDAEKQRIASGEFPTNIRFNEKLIYSRVTLFAEQVQRFLDVFERERVHIVLFDDLKRDTPGTYRGVLEFLGVDPEFAADFRRFNASKQPRSKPFRNLLKRPPRWVSGLTGVLPREFRQKALGGLIALNSKNAKRAPAPAEDRAALRRRFAPEVQRLGELIGRDLSAWSRPRP